MNLLPVIIIMLLCVLFVWALVPAILIFTLFNLAWIYVWTGLQILYNKVFTKETLVGIIVITVLFVILRNTR